jgi:mannose-6-phosphate isomerase-like protein (cupin superfamily)
MEQKKIPEIFEQGVVVFPRFETEANAKPWYSLQGSEGVFLKDLVTGKETGGKFSYHLVRIWKDGEVTGHDHETQWEWNLILSGKGTFVMGDKEVAVAPGQAFVTPPKNHHTVSAGHEDLSLIALFIPALV